MLGCYLKGKSALEKVSFIATCMLLNFLTHTLYCTTSSIVVYTSLLVHTQMYVCIRVNLCVPSSVVRGRVSTVGEEKFNSPGGVMLDCSKQRRRVLCHSLTPTEEDIETTVHVMEDSTHSHYICTSKQ